MRHKRTLVVALVLFVGATLACLALLRRSSVTAQVGGAKLILYWEPDFQGRSLEVTGTLPDLPEVTDTFDNQFNWNDEVRSIIVVSGTWRLYQHGRFNTELDDTPLESLDLRSKAKRPGWSCLVSATSQGPLELPNTAVGGFYHDVSSVELVSEKNLPDWAAPVAR
jgi:hypothetical protein